VRNLNNTDVGGRPLRIDLADSDPFLEGKTTVRGELIDSGESRSQWRERERDHDYGGQDRHSRPPDPNAFLASLPKGVPVPSGSTALDAISHTLATMNPSELMEVLAQMKVCFQIHKKKNAASAGFPQRRDLDRPLSLHTLNKHVFC
jgi:cleavage stimulation factor subunit 2